MFDFLIFLKLGIPSALGRTLSGLRGHPRFHRMSIAVLSPSSGHTSPFGSALWSLREELPGVAVSRVGPATLPLRLPLQGRARCLGMPAVEIF